ncbi:MAG: hypothetical protein AAFU38_11030, partial [Bacteroidota bacterium]
PSLFAVLHFVLPRRLVLIAACVLVPLIGACGSSEEVTAPPPQPRVVPPGSEGAPGLETLPETGTRTTDGTFRLRLPDTLRYAVTPGEAWVEALPREAEDNLIVYRALSAPALSWVVDGALFAQTLPTQRGTLRFDFQRSVGGYTDTLVVFLNLDEEPDGGDAGATSVAGDG